MQQVYPDYTNYTNITRLWSGNGAYKSGCRHHKEEQNTIKKWHWALGTIGIILLILILLPGTGERSVSNLYIIPAGTFSPFHEMNVPAEQNVTGNKIPEIPDKINSTALSIAFDNSEVVGSLTGVHYTILDVGPGTLTSGSIHGEEHRNLTRIDIDTDRALLTLWIDVSNRSVVYLNDYPKRSPLPEL